MAIKVFKNYYRIIYISFAVVFLTAVGLAILRFDNRLAHEKTLIRNHFEQNIGGVSRLIDACVYYMEAMRFQTENYLNSPALQLPHPFVAYLQNNKTENYFHLDTIPFGLTKYDVGNLTGLGQLENLNQTQRTEISAAFFLTPLLKTTAQKVPNAAALLYLSPTCFYSYPHPFSKDYRITPQRIEKVKKIYANVLPENNPDRKLVWSKAYKDGFQYGMIVSALVPVYQHDTYRSMLLIDITLDSLNSVIARTQRVGAEIFIVNEFDQLLAHPRLVSSKDTVVRTLAEALPQEMRAEVEQLSHFAPQELHHIGKYYLYYDQIPFTNWKLVYVDSAWDTYKNIFADIGLGVTFTLFSISLVLLITAYYTQKRFITPAQMLVQHIQNEVNNVPSKEKKIPDSWSVWFVIISDLFQKNRQMIDQLRETNESLEQKVQERTAALQEKQNEVVAQNEELQLQQEEIRAQRDFIEEKNTELEEKNTKITDSIRYAQTIQEAILPFTPRVQTILKDHFVIYYPRDMVSGDFYWIEAVDDLVVAAVVDCTGHGVPGAFMTMIAYALLNEIVAEKKMTAPADILNELNRLTRAALRQDEKDNTDGMDVCMCAWKQADNEKVSIEFAGAKLPLYIWDKAQNELLVMKGEARTIGGYWKKKHIFGQQTVVVAADSYLYLCSDGFADQHNPQHEKIGTTGLKELLNQITIRPFAEQKQQIETFFEQYKQREEQRDDVTLWGIRL